MRYAIRLGLLAAWFLLPAALLAQGTDQELTRYATSTVGSSAQMYEDVEVLRRLLNTKLEGQYAPLNGEQTQLVWECASCHGGDSTFLINKYSIAPASTSTWPGSLLRNDLRDYRSSGYPDVYNPVTLASPSWDAVNYHRLTNLTQHPTRVLDTEGTYIKGLGVIYTLTLPSSEEKPQTEPVKVSPPPLSDWDRVRREVRNEKPQPEAKKPEAVRPPRLEDILLAVLADNGHHLAQLGPNEAVVIAVTFRQPNMRSGVRANLFLIEDASKRSHTNTSESAKGANQPPPGSASGEPSSGTQGATDYELLGDLHQKQGKLEEAVKAFHTALEMKPDLSHQARLWRKLATIHLTTGKDQEARQALDRAMALRTKGDEKANQATAQASPATASLPSKLILSAPRNVLEDVGSGKLSLEEFRKAVKVERVGLPATTK